MSEELEKKLSRLELHAPSRELDRRIGELLRDVPTPSADRPARQVVRQDWKLLCTTAAGFLVIGFGLGLLASGARPTLIGNPHTDAVRQAPRSASPAVPASNQDLSSDSASQLVGLPTGETRTAKSPDDLHEQTNRALSRQQSTILGERWIETPDGRWARGYLTATRQRIWKFDEQSKTMQAHELTIPRLVVSSLPGI